MHAHVNGMPILMESVLYMTKEISGFNENGDENYFKKNLKLQMIMNFNNIKKWVKMKMRKGYI